MNKSQAVKQNGFTLIEAVVATSVFALIISAILGVYISVIQLDSKARAQRAVTQNARYIMEYMAKEIRNGSIDYNAYPSGSVAGVDNSLYITNQAGEDERFYLNGTNLRLAKSAGETNLNSSSVTVANFKVLVAPNTTPFTVSLAPTVNEQPRVTVILELESNLGSRPQDRASINVQSTFAVRNYPSRRP